MVWYSPLILMEDAPLLFGTRISLCAKLPPKCRGFTLVELLAGIAVAAILAALISTAISGARNSADSATCMANLKTLAGGHLIYLQEHNGYPPKQTYTEPHPESEGHNGPGIRLLRQYYRDGVLPGPRWVWAGAEHKFILEPAEICPALQRSSAFQVSEKGPHYDLHSPIDSAKKEDPTPENNFNHINYLAFYQKPSQRPLIWDGLHGGVWKTGDPQVPLVHNGAMHCAFLDGHIERIEGDDPRLYHRWWYYAMYRPEPLPSMLGQGTKMGVKTWP